MEDITCWSPEPTVETLNDYFGAMYPWLLATCINITGEPDKGMDLASFTVDWFLHRPEKAEKYAGTPLIFSLMLVKFAQTQNRFAHSYVRHTSSTWGAEQDIKANLVHGSRERFNAEHLQTVLEKTSEPDAPEDLGYLLERFDDAEVEKIVSVRKVIHRLPSHLKTIYDCHIEEQMPVRAIAKKFGMSTSSAFREVQAMREAVLELLGKQ